jgi:hypothetical protein
MDGAEPRPAQLKWKETHFDTFGSCRGKYSPIPPYKITKGDSLSLLLTGPDSVITDEGDMDVNLERLLKRHSQLEHGLPRVLELNSIHAIITRLAVPL